MAVACVSPFAHFRDDSQGGPGHVTIQAGAKQRVDHQVGIRQNARSDRLNRSVPGCRSIGGRAGERREDGIGSDQSNRPASLFQDTGDNKSVTAIVARTTQDDDG